MEDIRARIVAEVCSWEGVTADLTTPRGAGLSLDGHLLGYLDARGSDGEALVHVRFTERIAEMLIETGRAERQEADGAGWVSHPLDAEAVELFRLAYERARVARAVQSSREELGEARGTDVAAADDDADPPA